MSQEAGDRGEVSAFGGIYSGKVDIADVASTPAVPVTAAPAETAAVAEPEAEATEAVDPTEAETPAFADGATTEGEPEAAAETETEPTEEATEGEETPADFESKLADLAKPEKHKELGAMLAKHGLELDKFGRVAWVERKKFREEKANFQADLQRQAQQIEANLNHRELQVQTRESRVDAFEKAIEAGDFDGMAKAVGRSDWNAAQKEAVERLSDPTYQRLMKLERDKEEREKREQETAAQTRARHEQEQRQAQLNLYKTNELLPAMKASKDPIVANMVDDPLFVETVFSRQLAAVQRGEEPPTAEQVARDPAVRGHLQKLYSQLKAAFEPKTTATKPDLKVEGKVTPPVAKAPEVPAAKKKPVPKQVPAKGALGASGKGKSIDPTSDEWFRRTHAKLTGRV